MEVRRDIEHPNEINDFFKVTSHFKKRFYCVNHELGHPEGSTEAWIRIVAVGISRDLKYLIWWNIPCRKDEAIYEQWQHESNADHHLPPFGYIPLDEVELNWFYPRAKHGYKPGNYSDIFGYHGFIKVSSITDDKGVRLIEL